MEMFFLIFLGTNIIFPLNVTAAFQPLNMGVLIALKTVARKVMLLQIIANLEHFEEIRALNEKQPNGMRGIDYGFPAHVLDATRAIWKAFDSMSPKK